MQRESPAAQGPANRFTVWYDFACVAAAASRPTDAKPYLHEAVSPHWQGNWIAISPVAFHQG
jgi:hypothetical protein